MSTLKVTNIQHPSAENPAIELDPTDGVIFTAASFDAAAITSGVLDVARVPLAAGIGSNVVQTVKTDTFSTTSSSYTDVTGLSVAITPTSLTSRVLVIADLAWSQDNVNEVGHFTLTDGSNTNLVVPSAPGSRTPAFRGGYISVFGLDVQRATFALLHSPNTTSSFTYKVRARRPSGGTVFVNRSGVSTDSDVFVASVSTITAIEVAS